MSEYRISPRAMKDLEDIHYYIAIEKEAPINAKKFIKKLYKTFTFLSKNPNIGRSKESIRPGFMVWTESSYYVFYRKTKQSVDIIRIINSNRRIDKLF